MEVRTEDDIAVNRATMKQLVKPIIEFIKEHKDTRTRMSLLQICIEETISHIRVTPTEGAGCMISCIFNTFYEGYKIAELMSKTGTRGIRGVD